MNMSAAIEQKTAQPAPGDDWDFWSKRYATEGHLWGDDPSLTAERLADKLRRNSIVLEIGCGYGRDVVELVKQGHHVTGVENAIVGLNEATKSVREYIERGQAHFHFGDFTRAVLPDEGFDAVLSHRTLHLLGDNGLVRAFVNTSARALKTDGLLFVSARNDDDFNPKQMKRLDNGMVEYIKRPGHLISLWNETRFKEAFSKKFEIIGFEKGIEIESITNPVNSHFTIMKARKKPESNLN